MVQRLSLAEIILRLAFSRALHLFQVCPRPRMVIGLENLRHHLNQSNSRVKPILARSIVFSRALGSLLVYTLTCHWLLVK